MRDATRTARYVSLSRSAGATTLSDRVPFVRRRASVAPEITAAAFEPPLRTLAGALRHASPSRVYVRRPRARARRRRRSLGSLETFEFGERGRSTYTICHADVKLTARSSAVVPQCRSLARTDEDAKLAARREEAEVAARSVVGTTAGRPLAAVAAGPRQFSAFVAAPRHVTSRYEKSQGLVDPARRRVTFVLALS